MAIRLYKLYYAEMIIIGHCPENTLSVSFLSTRDKVRTVGLYSSKTLHCRTLKDLRYVYVYL